MHINTIVFYHIVCIIIKLHPEDRTFFQLFGKTLRFRFLFVYISRRERGRDEAQFSDEILWEPVPFLPGHWIVNLGTDLFRWTQQAAETGSCKPCKATLHRVVPMGKMERYSMPFFYEANLDTPDPCFPYTKRRKSDDFDLWCSLVKIWKLYYILIDLVSRFKMFFAARSEFRPWRYEYLIDEAGDKIKTTQTDSDTKMWWHVFLPNIDLTFCSTDQAPHDPRRGTEAGSSQTDRIAGCGKNGPLWQRQWKEQPNNGMAEREKCEKVCLTGWKSGLPWNSASAWA